ncbi:hypothetical protein AMAG_18500 [Allomyces macrogynus ATCC 38327]|uniref:Uncharacterized protein n=1 Tax=Allomyces macrogynus (strain ATCC 38327) TaxID=578462 RepID=A0A0L0SCT5_ALLM3|nr:hypothetical protein AMAG_18500 [Allomyces macrogynus ATCC 38327]|eukprot:KNE60252.1 hypothetical protein AMAG_18500 [Allomyces macrogynus ATCC 38327]
MWRGLIMADGDTDVAVPRSSESLVELLGQLPALTCSLKLTIPKWTAFTIDHLNLDRRLQHLTLHHDNNHGGFLAALAPLLPPSLVSLDLSKFDQDELGRDLFPHLPLTLESLTLQACALTTEHVAPLTTRWPPALIHLDLGDNQLSTVPTPLPFKLKYLGLKGLTMLQGTRVDDHVVWVCALPRSLRTLENAK